MQKVSERHPKGASGRFRARGPGRRRRGPGRPREPPAKKKEGGEESLDAKAAASRREKERPHSTATSPLGALVETGRRQLQPPGLLQLRPQETKSRTASLSAEAPLRAAALSKAHLRGFTEEEENSPPTQEVSTFSWNPRRLPRSDT